MSAIDRLLTIREKIGAQRPDLEFRKPGELRSTEIAWRDRQPWLEEHGYTLRPRYRPDWTPSWKNSRKKWDSVEDEQLASQGNLLDATRKSDGALVMIKAVELKHHPHEVEIAQYLSSSELAENTDNHCVPVYEVLQRADDPYTYLVMPFLRAYDDPPFQTVREVVEFFKQVFEGLHFMHQHHVAHRDCNANNIMMDPSSMYPSAFHPVKQDKNRDFKGTVKFFTRTEKSPRYLLVDFGISRMYTEDQLPVEEEIIRGGDKTVPEHKGDNLVCDPFATDIYYIGNMIRTDFLEKHKGFEFMKDLVSSMTQDDPKKRPTMDQVVAQFDTIQTRLSRKDLSIGLNHKKNSFFTAFLRGLVGL